MTSALAALLLALSFLIPEHYLPWDTARSQAVAALALLLLGVGAMQRRPIASNGVRWSLPWIAAIPLCLAPLPWLQWSWGTISFFSDALLPSLYLLAMTLAIGIGARWAAVDATSLLRALVLGLTLAAVLSAGIAVAQWLRIETPNYIVQLPLAQRPGGNLAQPNQLATLLLMGLSCSLLAFERRWLGGLATGLLSALFGLGLVCSMSRAGGVSAVMLVVAALVIRQRAWMRVPASALMLWLCATLALVLIWDALGALLGLSGPAMADRTEGGTRLIHWAVMWDAVRLAPWTGHGWNQVAMAQQSTAHLHPHTGELLQNSHNALLDLWVWIGLPAGSLAGGAVIWWFFSRWARCRNATQVCLMGAITAVLVHALLEYPLEYAYFLFPLGLLMGLVDGMAEPRAPAFRTGPGAPALALAGGAVMLVWVSVEYLQVEERFRDARVGLLGLNNHIEIVQPPAVLLLDGPREYHRLMISQAKADMTNLELEWMRRVAQRFPFPPAQLRYALAAGLNGQPGKARLTLRGLCAVHPVQRCDEGRAAWAVAQSHHPVLQAIAFPVPHSTDSSGSSPEPGGSAGHDRRAAQ